MKELFLWCSVAVLLGTGCVSKSKANAQAKAAYQAGRHDGIMMAVAQGPAVWVMGNVKTPVIPWTQGLTLSKAIIIAEYRGAKDPDEIIVQRKGQEPLHIHPQQLLRGEDMPLVVGDQIEIRP